MNHTLLLAHMLVVLFVGLKLTGYIAWSWWMVVAPLWIYALIALAVGFVFGFIGAYRAVRRNAIGKANDERRGEGRVES